MTPIQAHIVKSETGEKLRHPIPVSVVQFITFGSNSTMWAVCVNVEGWVSTIRHNHVQVDFNELSKMFKGIV